MKIDTLLQDVNIVVDWHDNGDFLDCYQEAENSKVKKVFILWRGSLYYDAARGYIQKHFEIARRAVKENKLYRRELPDKTFMLDSFEMGDDLRFYLHADGANGDLMYHDEFDRPEEAVAGARELVASGEANHETVEIEEERNAMLRLSLDEAIARYGVKETA